MRSEIWDDKTAKPFTVGYDLQHIKLFDEQCEKFLRSFLFENSLIDQNFELDSNNLQKANFLILNEITSALYDCLYQIKDGNIRIASRIFRDVLENMHILELFNIGDNKSYLVKWYDNEVISHSNYRDWIKKKDADLSELNRVVYRLYSKYAHRTFKPIMENFDIIDGRLKFNFNLNNENPEHLKILSKFYSHLSYFVMKNAWNYVDYNVHSKAAINRIISDME